MRKTSRITRAPAERCEYNVLSSNGASHPVAIVKPRDLFNCGSARRAGFADGLLAPRALGGAPARDGTRAVACGGGYTHCGGDVVYVWMRNECNQWCVGDDRRRYASSAVILRKGYSHGGGALVVTANVASGAETH